MQKLNPKTAADRERTTGRGLFEWNDFKGGDT